MHLCNFGLLIFKTLQIRISLYSLAAAAEPRRKLIDFVYVSKSVKTKKLEDRVIQCYQTQHS